MHEKHLRVIQVGVGGFGRSWAGIVHRAQGVALVAVVDPSTPARQWALDTLGLGEDQVFENLTHALKTVSCEAVLVITPPATHHAIATQALLDGKHVVLEKPLASTFAEANDLITTAEQQGKMLVVSQNYRFRAPARTVQHFIAGGYLGDLLSVQVACRRDSRDLWPVDNFRYHMRHPYIVDIAIHHFDLLRAMTGRNVASIDARSWRIPNSPFRHDPAVTALLDLEDGVPVLYEGNWATSEVETSWNGDWVFVGKNGRLAWDGGVDNPLEGRIRFFPNDGPPHDLAQLAPSSLDRTGSLLAFRDAVHTGGARGNPGRGQHI